MVPINSFPFPFCGQRTTPASCTAGSIQLPLAPSSHESSLVFAMRKRTVSTPSRHRPGLDSTQAGRPTSPTMESRSSSVQLARISHHVSSGAPACSRLGVPECPKPVTDRRSARSGIQAGGEKCSLSLYTAALPPAAKLSIFIQPLPLRPSANCLFLYSQTPFASSRSRSDGWTRLVSLSPREARVGREPERGAA